MNNFLKISFLSTVITSMFTAPSHAMSDPLDLDQAIAIIDTYRSTENEIRNFDQALEEKEKHLVDVKAHLEELELEITQAEETLRKVLHITPGENIQVTIDKLNGERQKLIIVSDKIDLKKEKLDYLKVAARMEEERLHKSKTSLIEQKEALAPCIKFYDKFFAKNKQMTAEALCRCAKKGLLYAMTFFVIHDRVSLGFVNFENRTILHQAAVGGNTRLIKYILYQNEMDNFLKNGLHDIDINGMTALEVALDQGNEDAAKMLLNACRCQTCIDICKRACKSDGLTSLTWAIKRLSLQS